MTRQSAANLTTKTARLELPETPPPYWVTLTRGISLGYRKGVKASIWMVRAADGKDKLGQDAQRHRRRPRGSRRQGRDEVRHGLQPGQAGRTRRRHRLRRRCPAGHGR